MQAVPAIMFLCWWTITMAWWALAFAPQALSPEWLVRTQFVCFGTLANGLPDPSGWIKLIVGPLPLFVGLIAVWGTEIRTGIRSIIKKPALKLVISTMVLILVAESAWVTHRIHRASLLSYKGDIWAKGEAFPDTYPRTQKVAPKIELTDQSGRQISLSDQKGKVTFVTFAFAHCQTICPLLVRNTLDAASEINSDDVQVFIVTLDPWRDTPSTLPSLADKWDLPEYAHVMSGDIADVESILDAYNVGRGRDEKTGDIGHPPLVYLVDRSGKLAYSLNNPSLRWLTEAAEKLS